jgi:dTDP-glucose 4,6-dehydratase
MNSTKILITGSGGFIFSNFVRYVLYRHKEYSLISVDKITEPKNLHNIYSNRDHKFYIADITDRHVMDNIFNLERPDIVVHGAAESNVDDSIKGANQFILSNVLGTQIIVDMCVKYDVRKMVYVSSDEIYGQLSSPSVPAWNEQEKLAPRNPYSASKAAGELVVQAAGSTFGLNYNIMRSCNNYGPRQSLKNLIRSFKGVDLR